MPLETTVPVPTQIIRQRRIVLLNYRQHQMDIIHVLVTFIFMLFIVVCLKV